MLKLYTKNKYTLQSSIPFIICAVPYTTPKIRVSTDNSSYRHDSSQLSPPTIICGLWIPKRRVTCHSVRVINHTLYLFFGKAFTSRCNLKALIYEKRNQQFSQIQTGAFSIPTNWPFGSPEYKFFSDKGLIQGKRLTSSDFSE